MGRKDTQAGSSKSSSSAAVTASNRQKSSILKSAFTPSQFQLHLFASVIQSFDTHQLRIHDTATGRLRSQHESKSKITSLDWGYYGAAYRERQQSKKKRKRNENNGDGAVVAYGTNASHICMFSPVEGRTVATLTGGHERGIKDFRFSPVDYLQGWSIGEDAKLVQWDLTKDQPIRTINLPDPSVNLLGSPSNITPHLLCASSTPFAIDITSFDDFRIDRFDSFKNAIHSLWRSQDSQYFLAADSDRYINIYSIQQKKLVRTLVAGSGATATNLSTPSQESTDFLHKQQMLCVVTKDGTAELFSNPFAEAKQINGDLKSSRKNLTRKASATVRLVNPDSKNKSVPIVAAFVQGSDLIVVSTDGGVDLAFQKVRWQDEGNGELLFDGVKDVVKTRSASTLNSATLNGVKDMGKTTINESQTVVVNGGAGAPNVVDAIEISSSESEEEGDGDDEESAEETSVKEEDEDEASGAESDDSDEEMVDADAESANAPVAEGQAVEAEEPEPAEPSFADLLAAQHPAEISINAALPADPSTSLTLAPKSKAMALPTGMSLGTVLTQALRTNDTPLLETCLHTLDLNIVKSTIQRLESSLAGLLLSKLAERLASRPGRYGHLITWVQWICIVHGGAIAAQPQTIRQVKTLYEVLGQRMRTLDDLLLLKGKLDLLDAQLQFRRTLASQRDDSALEGRGEPGMIYIEGQKGGWESEDEEDEEDDLDEDIAHPAKKARRGGKDLDDLVAGSGSDEDEEDEDMPLANGASDLSTSEDEEDDSEDEDALPNGALIDDEASVSSAEDSDPDDLGPSPVASSSSAASSSSGSEDENEDDEEEEDEQDSELEAFINDGSVDFSDAEDEIHVEGDSSDEEAEEVETPAPAPVVEKKAKVKAKAEDVPALPVKSERTEKDSAGNMSKKTKKATS
ncbi:Small subunit (SSU) processome component [Cladophialophora chaetospira]|uniref:Small subunit (SSU) processome component n=1 Tax=Cladophialophora chaetospira TaxID=386627 RepID=A0AA38XJH4_9EURO|nr:Small subunit (SSU) processome component [Cladophialophora chaetospira]